METGRWVLLYVCSQEWPTILVGTLGVCAQQFSIVVPSPGTDSNKSYCRPTNKRELYSGNVNMKKTASNGCIFLPIHVSIILDTSIAKQGDCGKMVVEACGQAPFYQFIRAIRLNLRWGTLHLCTFSKYSDNYIYT